MFNRTAVKVLGFTKPKVTKFLVPRILSKKFYSTETQESEVVQKVELLPEIAKYLKPEVIEAINAKQDEKLVKKLNFVGKGLAIRLNVAKKVVLDELNGDTIFRVLKYDLMDPWDYYWEVICENGNDPEKWYKSMQEVAHLPLVLDRCFYSMSMHGVYPTVKHYNLVLRSYIPFFLVQDLHLMVDRLRRFNLLETEEGKENNETVNILLEFYLKLGLGYPAKLIAQYMKDKGFTMTEENKKMYEVEMARYEEVLKQIPQTDPKDEFTIENIESFSQVFENSAYGKYYSEAYKRMEEANKRLLETAEESVQPPLEKLVVKQEY